MECPNCRHEQDKGFDDCKSCGFVLNAGSDQNDQDNDEEILTSMGLLLPAAAALLGALVWMGIAIGIGWEFGFIAWAIGGAIGFASTLTDNQGVKYAVCCAVLALLSIMGGKYFSAVSVKNELMSDDSYESEWLQYEDEYRLDARDLASMVVLPKMP